jgi:ketosteroid isomerase-like protein
MDSGLHKYANTIESFFRTGDADAEHKPEELANVRLVQDAVVRIGLGKLDALAELLTDDVRLEINAPEDFVFDRSATGTQGVIAALEKNFAMVKDQRPRIEAVIAQGDTVVVVFRDEGVLIRTGESYSVEGMHRFVCRDGRIAFLQELAVRS